MGKIRIYAEIADEARKIQKDYSLDYNAAIRKAKEIYIDKLKAHCSTDQSKNNEHKKLFNSILPPGTDIDNDQIYEIETNKVIRDL